MNDITKLYSLYNEFNTAYFGGELPKIKIAYSSTLRSLGRAHCTTNRFTGIVFTDSLKITISAKYKLNEEQLRSVMCHEMIHIYQYLSGKNDGHGYYFIKKADEICKQGGPIITEKYDDNIHGNLAGTANGRCRKVSVWCNGNKVRVCVTENTSNGNLVIERLKVSMPTSYTFKETFFDVKDEFARFHSIRSCRFYPIDMETYNKITEVKIVA